MEAQRRTHSRPNWILALRFMILGFGFVAGMLLLTRGDVVLGAVIVGWVVLRLILLLTVRHRHGAMFGASGARGALGVGLGVGPGVGPLRELRPLAPDAFRTAASKLGVEPSELRRSFTEGRSIAEVAADADVPVDRVVDAIVSDTRARLERAVSEGRMTTDDADRAKGNVPRWASRLVTTHRNELPARASRGA